MANRNETGDGYRLPEREGRGRYIRDNFDSIAHRYDRFNDFATFGFHRLWKRSVIRLTGLKSGQTARVLDLCCGSGDLSLLLARYLSSESEVVSLDFSPQMLAVLSKRIEELSEKRAPIRLLEGDATNLREFQDNSFDAVTIGFGLRNVQDRAACLAEVYRVLKPGSNLVILEVGTVRPKLPAAVHQFYFNRVVPRIGHFVHGSKHEMYDYLPASAGIYPDQEGIKRELEEVGFHQVIYDNRFLGATVIHVAGKPGEGQP